MLSRWYAHPTPSSSVKFKDSILTGQDGHSNPDLIGHLKVWTYQSV